MKTPVLSPAAQRRWSARTFVFLVLLLAVALTPATRADDAKPWRWEPSLVPRALVVEGLWSDFFRIEPAMHSAGLRYEQAYISRSPYFGGYSRLYHMPTDAELSPYLKYGFGALKCPAGGNYTINPTDQLPTCSVPNHRLPPE